METKQGTALELLKAKRRVQVQVLKAAYSQTHNSNRKQISKKGELQSFDYKIQYSVTGLKTVMNEFLMCGIRDETENR